MSNIEITMSPTPVGTSTQIVSSSMFGGILINKNDFDDFTNDSDYLSTTIVRYPGGAFAEVGVVVNGQLQFAPEQITFSDLNTDRSNFAIDLTFPEFFNPILLSEDTKDGGANSYASLSEAMALSIENNTSLSLILPTTRYFSGIDTTNPEELNAMLTLADQDIRLFLNRLASGEYNGGEYPETIILEIGNENYSNPIEYALIAAVYINAIEDVLGGSEVSYQIAFQMNNGASQFLNLQDAGYFDPFFDEDGNANIPQLIGFEFDPNVNYTFPERVVLIEQMMAYILGDEIVHIDLLRHHFLSIDGSAFGDDSSIFEQRQIIQESWLNMIDAAGGDSDSVEYYVSAWTTDGNDSSSVAGSMTAATNSLLAMSQFVMMGVDLAAVWGINGSTGYWPDKSPDTVLTFSEQEGVTPGGEAFRLMSESIVGLYYIETVRDRHLNMSDPLDYLEFVYSSDQQTVLFIAVGDISDDGLTINVDLSAFGYFSEATIDNLGTEDGTDFGLAKVETQIVQVTQNTVAISVDQDYEVVRIIVDNLAKMGTSGADFMEGTASVDYIMSREGADRVSGWAGDDRLYGEEGDDLIYGNTGSDALFGGSGYDTLYGGDGFDFLEGGSEDDQLFGHTGNDTLIGGEGSDSLFGGSGDDLLLGSDNTKGNSLTIMEFTEGSEEWWSEFRGLFDDNVLSGGAGDDILVGGKGSDTFIFEEGNDTIRDFQTGVDNLLISLNSIGLTIEEANNSLLAAVTGAGFVSFSFSNEDKITIYGVELLPEIYDDILFI